MTMAYQEQWTLFTNMNIFGQPAICLYGLSYDLLFKYFGYPNQRYRDVEGNKQTAG